MTGIPGSGDAPGSLAASQAATLVPFPAPQSAARTGGASSADGISPAALSAAQFGAINGSTLVVAGGGVSLQNLRTALSTVFSRFYDGADLLRVVDRAMQAVLPLVDRSAGAVSFRIVAVDTVVGGDPRFGAAARVSGLGLEVGAVRAEGLRPEDLKVLSLDGAEVALDRDARADGLARGRYEVRADARDAEADARLADALDALRRLSETVDALTAFRRGDGSAIERLAAGLRRDEGETPAAAG
jgi:hypothetical protein